MIQLSPIVCRYGPDPTAPVVGEIGNAWNGAEFGHLCLLPSPGGLSSFPPSRTLAG